MGRGLEGFNLAANLGVGRGENKDFVPVDVNTDILPFLDPHPAAHARLQRPVKSLHGHVNQVHLTEEAA